MSQAIRSVSCTLQGRGFGTCPRAAQWHSSALGNPEKFSEEGAKAGSGRGCTLREKGLMQPDGRGRGLAPGCRKPGTSRTWHLSADTDSPRGSPGQAPPWGRTLLRHSLAQRRSSFPSDPLHHHSGLHFWPLRALLQAHSHCPGPPRDCSPSSIAGVAGLAARGRSEAPGGMACCGARATM